MLPGVYTFSSGTHECGVFCQKLNHFTFNKTHMTTQSKTRFADALALSETLTMDTDKLQAMIDLVIPENDRKTLWKNVELKDGVAKATVTPLHVMIFGYCQTTFNTELERDAAYLLYIKQIIEFDTEELQVFFKWYTEIPTEGFIIRG